jgi:hypothetical protein
MLGCRPVISPIDVKANISVGKIEHIDRERYPRLIYLCHTRSDISFAVSIVSRYMNDLGRAIWTQYITSCGI